MNWIDILIADFGRQAGIQNLRMNSNQRLRLDSNRGTAIGMINLQSLPLPELVIYVAWPASYFPNSQVITALQFQNFRQVNPWQLQAASNEKEIYLAFRIPQRSASIPTINEAIKLLQNIITRQFQ